MKKDIITDEKLQKYTELTGRAISKLVISVPEEGLLRKAAEDYLGMAKNYYNDSKHFASRGDFVNAFACLNYAYGWIDAGARLGLFDVGSDHTLFTLSK